MFSLLNPIFLWAAAAAIIPVVLHMIQSRRTVKMPFSTIRFLKLAEKQSSRRIKMEHFLLWLLRTLILLLIALAFAMPMFRTQSFGNFLKGAQRDVAIVIDTSYSMRYVTGKRTAWERAAECAVAVLEGLNPGDQVCLFTCEEDVKPIIKMLTEEKEPVVARIKALRPTFFSSQLAPAIMAAADSLKEETHRREREIHVITDNQLLPWTGFRKIESSDSAVAAGWDPKVIGDKTVVFFSLLGATSPENTSPIDVTIEPELIMVDTPIKITVKLAHSGPPKNTSVSVYVDDQETAHRSVIVGGDAQSEYAFSVPPLPPGTHAARIELLDDNLPDDGVFHFLLKVRDKLPTLCVGNKDDVLFLMKALSISLSKTSSIDVKHISQDELSSENFTDYSCIFLCDALPLSGQEMLDMERYVRSGGLLVIFPGDNASVTDYKPWTCLPALPTGLKDVSERNRKMMLRWRKPQHAILRKLSMETGGAPVITIRRLLALGELEADTETLVTAGAEEPFILERQFGKGRVLLFGVSANRAWSSLPLSPYYLPLTHEIAKYGAGIGDHVPYIWTTRSLPLSDYLPEAVRDSSIQDPDGNNVSIQSAIMDNRTVFHAENLTTPGIYSMMDSKQQRVPALAVNMSRIESDLTPINVSDIEKITGLRETYIATSKDELLKQIEDHRMGKTMGEQLLWLILILATVEFFYANMLSRETPKLTDELGIAVSGKVEGPQNS
ncbi:MAG: BatA domain-containing protein [Lentisphaerae bacterium]|nr:BatA domain-containing protein [Lentisphaerota bacterium]